MWIENCVDDCTKAVTDLRVFLSTFLQLFLSQNFTVSTTLSFCMTLILQEIVCGKDSFGNREIWKRLHKKFGSKVPGGVGIRSHSG